MNTTAHIFAARDIGAFMPAIVLGQGLPAEIDKQPVAYYWKEMLPVGDFNDADGNRVVVPPSRIEKIIQCFNRAKEKGYRPYLPDRHHDRTKNYGFLQDVRKGANGSLEGLHQFIGEDAIREAARNKSSICTLRNVTDEHGDTYEELIDHNAVLPDPRLSGLGDFVPFNPALAASRGQPISVETLELAAPTQESEMDITSLRKAIGAADAVSDADVITQATTKLGTLPALEASLATAKADLELSRKAEKDASDKVLELGRKPAYPDDITLGLISESLVTKRDAAVAAGGVDPKTAELLMSLVAPDGRPNSLALSRAVGSTRPFAFRLFDTLAENKPLSLGQKTAAQPVPRSVPGASQQTEAEIQAEVDANLARTELGRRAIAARK